MQLAKSWDGKTDIVGWLISEKLNGERAWWDGGITRGRTKESVPWANTAKDARFRESQRSTGLWSRGGHVIMAPPDWLDMLPQGLPLDGELYIEGVSRQKIHTLVAGLRPTFVGVRFHVFDIPNLLPLHYNVDSIVRARYTDRYARLTEIPGVVAVPQMLVHSAEAALTFAQTVVVAGGEGAMVRDPAAQYINGRTGLILKIKPTQDAEATVIGWKMGNGKYEGMLGALHVQMGNVRLFVNLRGDEMREMITAPNGAVLPVQYVRGQKVRIEYAGLTDDGIPTEARLA